MQNIIIIINTINVTQYGNGDDDLYMKSHYKSDTEGESESDTVEESESDSEGKCRWVEEKLLQKSQVGRTC